MLGGPKYQHDDSLDPCVSIHHISTLFPPGYDIRWLIDGKFRGVAARIDDLMSIWIFRGGRCKIYEGCWFEISMLVLNNNQLQLLNWKGIKQWPLVYPSGLYAHERSFVPAWKVMEADWCEVLTILSQISVVVDLHEGSGLITQQIITNSITLL